MLLSPPALWKSIHPSQLVMKRQPLEKKPKWRFMEGDGDEGYLFLLCPPPPLRHIMTDPHMDTLPSRCMGSTHEGRGRGLAVSLCWVHRLGGWVGLTIGCVGA